MRMWTGDWRHRISYFKSQNGFTLLEVTVAMVIVGLGVVTLIEIFSLGLRLEAKSSGKTESVAYGRRVADELLVRHDIGNGKEQGIAGGKYQWRLEVDHLNVGPALPSPGDWELKEIMLKMQYPDQNQKKGVEINTLRLVKKRGL